MSIEIKEFIKLIQNTLLS